LAKGIVIAAPWSGSGKTVATLGVLRALRNRGMKVASAKAGPDYIDPRFHEAASGRPCFNLDLWAMGRERVAAYLDILAKDTDIVVVEGVMGLFDGPEKGRGSTADLAIELDLPTVLAIDCSAMAQSVAAIVRGFGDRRPLAGVILNRVASERHERVLKNALGDRGCVLGAIRRNQALSLPSRHLGLVQAAEKNDLEVFLNSAAGITEASIDLDELLRCAGAIKPADVAHVPVPSLGKRVAVASDRAFAFSYPHLLHDWRSQGAEIVRFSPLADEEPSPDADAVYLPGGYPELHATALAGNARFLKGVNRAAAEGALVYGECGGLMVLGEKLIDASGNAHGMAGLLPITTSFARRELHLGYRRLSHSSPLPFGREVSGHEFHYSTIASQGKAAPLFEAADAAGEKLAAMGLMRGNVMGSYAHVIA
jgi:cobyrinic acid a,c-diamide synthase